MTQRYKKRKKINTYIHQYIIATKEKIKNIFMKVLVATEKPFASAAVEGIRKEVEAAGHELALLEKYTEKAQLLDAVKDADALIIRSDKVDAEVLDAAKQLKIVVRAGAGYDNIDLAAATAHNVVAENTPGQNANAVAELVLGMMVYKARNFFDGSTGKELRGKKIGVVGMGNVGRIVANICTHLGMDVYGYDPFLSVDAAWMISNRVTRVSSLNELCGCDFITLHAPLTELTENMVNEELLSKMKDGVRIINYARQEIVNEEAMVAALESGKVARYVTDFPTNTLIGRKNVVMTPHLGGTTYEAEENCAIMAARQSIDYMENGNIVNSVNFGQAVMAPSLHARLCVFHKNIPSVIAQITSAVSARGLNIENMVNASMKGFPTAYTMLELSQNPDSALINAVKAVSPVIRVRAIPSKTIQ